MNHPGPICSGCTRDWDERLGFCEHCQPPADADSNEDRTASDTPLYDQLVASLKIGHRRSNANTPGMWEDNFS